MPLNNHQYLLDEEVIEMDQNILNILNNNFKTYQLIKLLDVGEIPCDKLAKTRHIIVDATKL